MLFFYAYAAGLFARLYSGVELGVACGMLVDYAAAYVDGGVDFSVVRAAVFGLDVERASVDPHVRVEAYIHRLYVYHGFRRVAPGLRSFRVAAI
jgi:hypothetical protein